MKFWIFAAFIGATAASSAFAQSNPSQNGSTTNASQLGSSTQTVASVAAPWSPAPTTGKTRAQVYQELVEAQQDGQMAYLKELYKGR